MSGDATSLVYKEALSRIEDRMPGTRIVFYQGFLDPSNPLRKRPETATPEDAPGTDAVHGTEVAAGEGEGTARTCVECGTATFTETCSFCRLKERVRKARSLRAATISR